MKIIFSVQNILIDMNFGGDEHIIPYIFCLLLKKMKKVQEHDLYLNQIIHHFDLRNFFLG